MYTYGGTFTITSSTFTHNTAAVQGGVMFTFGDYGTFTIMSSTFANNTADLDGGVIITFFRVVKHSL